MRWLVVLLVVALAALVIVTFASPGSVLEGAGDAWFPAAVASGATIVDGLFDEITRIALALFVLTFSILAWAVVRGARRRSDEGSESHGSAPLELAWTVAPAAIVLFLTWSQVVARAEIESLVEDAVEGPVALVVEVEGAQFDWRFRYAGADGSFGTWDDVTEPVDLVVPIGRNVELRMRSVDVIHSFFVPALRMKRDVVPGVVVPLRFRIDAESYAAAGSPETLELRCAELCGSAHYAMVGRVVPMDGDAFDAWTAERAEWRAAGADESDDEYEEEDDE